MQQNKLNYRFWFYNLIPEKIVNFLILIRFEKPIGFLLLMWPCWFALAILSVKNLKYYILLFIGSFCMRGVGCIINDYLDRDIDIKVNRTSQRPLAQEKITIVEALILMIILLIISFFILIQFSFQSIVLTSLSIPLIIIYPLMKRYTYWPQLILGITFNWGILVVFLEFEKFITTKSILLYIACIFWTLGYDTIYAYQDKKDDIKINLKSTAILFANKGKYFVMLFYSFFVLFIGFSVNFGGFQLINSIVLIGIFIFLMFVLYNWNLNSPSSSNKYFKANGIIGLVFFLYLFFTN